MPGNEVYDLLSSRVQLDFSPELTLSIKVCRDHRFSFAVVGNVGVKICEVIKDRRLDEGIR